jgi:ABC-2 type transport system permease protein
MALTAASAARGRSGAEPEAKRPESGGTVQLRRPRVRHFVRLKLRILRNGLRGSGWRIVLFVFGILMGLEFAFAGFIGFTLAGVASMRTATMVTAFVGAALVLGWTLIPLLFFGVDETLDPARFALLPVPRRTLAVGMLVAALVGIPPVATFLALLGLVLGAGIKGGAGPAAVAAVGGALALALCIVASRAITSAFASALRSRRARDLAAILIAVLAASFGLLPATLQMLAPQIRLDDAARMADLLAWTPLAAPFVAPYDVAAGHPLVALARLLITAATVGLLVLAFTASLEKAMIGTTSGGRRAKRTAPVDADGPTAALYPRPLRALPRTQFGALLARDVRYWWRDPRRRANLITIVITSLMFAFAYQLIGVGLRAAVVMVGVFAGLGLANQFGYEGTAFAAHLLAGVPGRTELRARAASLAVIIAPVLLAVVIGIGVIRGESTNLPVVIGILGAGFGTSLGLSSLISVIAAYPMPESTNPFVTNAGTGTARGLLAFVALFGAAALSSPVVAAGFLLPGGLSWLVLVVGVGYGIAAVLLGTYITGDRIDRHGPELLSAVTPRR